MDNFQYPLFDDKVTWSDELATSSSQEYIHELHNFSPI